VARKAVADLDGQEAAWVSIPDAASRLGMSMWWVKELARAEGIERRRQGNRLLVNWTSVEELIARSRIYWTGKGRVFLPSDDDIRLVRSRGGGADARGERPRHATGGTDGGGRDLEAQGSAVH
jgi:hypothetical protein